MPVQEMETEHGPQDPNPAAVSLHAGAVSRDCTGMSWPASLFLSDLLAVESGLEGRASHFQTLTPTWSPQGSFKELVYVFFMVKDAGLTPRPAVLRGCAAVPGTPGPEHQHHPEVGGRQSPCGGLDPLSCSPAATWC